jgi:hypothetical protein
LRRWRPASCQRRRQRALGPRSARARRDLSRRACLQPCFHRRRRAEASLPTWTEAVAQTLGGDQCRAAGGSLGWSSAHDGVSVSPPGAVSGPHIGDLVAVDLGEVLGHHQ